MNSLENAFAMDLQGHLSLCQEVLNLAISENQGLAGQDSYAPFEYCQKRKNLLPRLEQSVMALRKWRHRWQQADPTERAGCSEVKVLFQSVQSLLMRVLLLDRENQQALLRRGLLPPRHVPSSAMQQSHCVADVYRRHSRS
jgi:hypothetical protein